MFTSPRFVIQFLFFKKIKSKDFSLFLKEKRMLKDTVINNEEYYKMNRSRRLNDRIDERNDKLSNVRSRHLMLILCSVTITKHEGQLNILVESARKEISITWTKRRKFYSFRLL